MSTWQDIGGLDQQATWLERELPSGFRVGNRGRGVRGYRNVRGRCEDIDHFDELAHESEAPLRDLVKALCTMGGALETCCADVIRRPGTPVWTNGQYDYTYVIGLRLALDHWPSPEKTVVAIRESARLNPARLDDVLPFRAEATAPPEGWWWKLELKGSAAGPRPKRTDGYEGDEQVSVQASISATHAAVAAFRPRLLELSSRLFVADQLG